MKIRSDAAASHASNWFGQFAIEKGGGGSGERECFYKKGTFFSWITHCVRFQFSSAYRKNIIAERQEILRELESNNHPQQADPATEGVPRPKKQLASAGLFTRSRFNNRVSEMLGATEPPEITVEPVLGAPEPQEITVGQQKILGLLSLKTNTVLYREPDPGGFEGDGQEIRARCKPPLYVIKAVESALEERYIKHAPQFFGPDKDGELCKRFLTYYTFSNQMYGAREGNLFDWVALDQAHFDPSQAYPTVAAESLSPEGWNLRVPNERLVHYAATLADAVRGKSPRDAYDFVEAQERSDNAEIQDVAEQFSSFLLQELGDDLLSSQSGVQ